MKLIMLQNDFAEGPVCETRGRFSLAALDFRHAKVCRTAICKT